MGKPLSACSLPAVEDLRDEVAWAELRRHQSLVEGAGSECPLGYSYWPKETLYAREAHSEGWFEELSQAKLNVSCRRQRSCP